MIINNIREKIYEYRKIVLIFTFIFIILLPFISISYCTGYIVFIAYLYSIFNKLSYWDAFFKCFIITLINFGSVMTIIIMSIVIITLTLLIKKQLKKYECKLPPLANYIFLCLVIISLILLLFGEIIFIPVFYVKSFTDNNVSDFLPALIHRLYIMIIEVAGFSALIGLIITSFPLILSIYAIFVFLNTTKIFIFKLVRGCCRN